MKMTQYSQTLLEEGAFGMYLLLHPFPALLGYIYKQKTVLLGKSPIPLHH
jgi:hypothetical protein